MKGIRNIAVRLILGISISLAAAECPGAERIDECRPADALELLPGPGEVTDATEGQVYRLLPFSLGITSTISPLLSDDSLLSELRRADILSSQDDVQFDRKLTKGRLSLILCGTVLKGKGSLIERALIWLFSSQRAAFRVAARERFVPSGRPDEILKSHELAASIFIVGVVSMSKTEDRAAAQCIEEFVDLIADHVLPVDAVRKTLRLQDPDFIRAMLSL